MERISRRRLAVALLAAALLPACEDNRLPRAHRLVTGVVESVRPEAGQLVVRRLPGRSAGEERVAGLLTSDSEIYINDRFGRAEEIAVGDAIKVIGHRDPNPRSDFFLVSSARITRPAEPPPQPPIVPSPQES